MCSHTLPSFFVRRARVIAVVRWTVADTIAPDASRSTPRSDSMLLITCTGRPSGSTPALMVASTSGSASSAARSNPQSA